MISNQCTTVSVQSTSCSYSNCKSSWNKLSQCTCSIVKAMGGSKYYCSAGFTTWKIIVSVVVPIVAILLIIILVVVLFLSCRKKKDYDQI
jgi:uncharacterized membrane protein